MGYAADQGTIAHKYAADKAAYTADKRMALDDKKEESANRKDFTQRLALWGKDLKDRKSDLTRYAGKDGAALRASDDQEEAEFRATLKAGYDGEGKMKEAPKQSIVSVDDYVKKALEKNPKADPKEVREYYNKTYGAKG